MIDTHAHLYSSEFDADRDAVIARALDMGMEKILLPNVSLDTIEPMLKLEASNPTLFASMMGIHPCDLKEDFRTQLSIAEYWFDKHNFIGVGEIGIDLYWDKTKEADQKDAFITQLGWAKERHLPVSIHIRDAFDETLAILDKEQDGRLTGAIHCFIGSVDQAKHITQDLGLYLGLGGISTFKSSHLTSIIPQLDLDTIILETDCPYLSPVPKRGKRNEPGFTQYVAQHIANTLYIPTPEVEAKTTANAKRLFNL